MVHGCNLHTAEGLLTSKRLLLTSKRYTAESFATSALQALIGWVGQT